MTFKDKIWSVAKYLPGCSFFNYFDSTKVKGGSEELNIEKCVMHTIYGVGFGLALLIWGTTAIKTGEINPFKQRQVQRQYETRVQEEDKLYDKIFGPKGFADKDKDGKFSFSEMKDAYRRMGFSGDLYYGNLKKPSLQQLIKAVGSYENEKE